MYLNTGIERENLRSGVNRDVEKEIPKLLFVQFQLCTVFNLIFLFINL